MSQYRLIFTNIGLSKKQNAELNNDYIQITQFAVGSGVIVNLNPSLTALLIEEYRANINNVVTKDGTTIFDLVIPSEVGGFWIKEVALFDVDGDCICIGTVPITYKVNQIEGASKAIHLKVSTTSTNTENIIFNTDDSLVYATVSWVDSHVKNKQNPHGVTKKQIGLGDVDNTKDMDKPISTLAANAFAEKINIADIKDNLTSSDKDKPLSALQGKVLKEYIDRINTLLLSDNSSLDNIQELVDFLELHQVTLDTLKIGNIAGLQNALNEKLGINSNAVSASKLATARLIGGVSFDGTVNINLPGVNIKGNQDTSGTADNAKYQQLIGGQTTCDTYFKATPAGKTSFNEINSLSDAPTATDWYFLQNIRHSNSSSFWGSQIAYSLNSGTSNKIWQRTIDAGTWSSWTRVDVSGANISELVNNVGYITADGRAYPRKIGGGNLNFNWAGQGGQPDWLWGGNDGENMYVYSPSNFVCYRVNDLWNHQWDYKSTNGYIRLSTGLIIQWGEISIQTSGHVNWSTAFPNVCVQATVSQGYAGNTSTDALASIYNLSKTGADIQNGQNTGGIMRYIAIGW